MCCQPQLELGRFDCLQAPHGNWEVEEEENTQTLCMATRPGSLWHFGGFENGEGHSAKEVMWVGRAQMRARRRKPCRRNANQSS